MKRRTFLSSIVVAPLARMLKPFATRMSGNRFFMRATGYRRIVLSYPHEHIIGSVDGIYGGHIESIDREEP